MHFERDLLPEIWIFSDAYLGITGTHLPSAESYAMLTKEQQVRRYPQNRQNHAYVICERSLTSHINRPESLCVAKIFVQRTCLHTYCEDIIAPGTLGHIAQKTLHLAATNSTTGQHHNTNFFSHLQNPPTPGPAKGPQTWPGNTSFAPAK